MWSTLERTYRRLISVVIRPALEFSAPETQNAAPAADVTSQPPADLVIAIGRPEFDRLGVALQAALGPGTKRLDTPDRLEAALADAIAAIGATGRPRVARRPAGLYTPEAWQVQLTAAEPTIEIAIRRAIREGVFAA
ncbi:MAG TPA: hypothetical protein VM408_02425 [Methylomirabilota bacterium]|nr:hypothetical protein [Methylomirabilota bacterium]